MLSTDDIVFCCAIPKTTLQRWIARGYVKPVVKGRVGRGHPDKFAANTAFGIAIAAAMYTTTGARPSVIREMIAKAEKIDEQELVAWTRGKRCPYLEERAAADRSRRAPINDIIDEVPFLTAMRDNVNRLLDHIREQGQSEPTAERITQTSKTTTVK